jgi:hypothetical protein
MLRKERYRVLPLLKEWVVRRERDGVVLSAHPTEQAAQAAASDLAGRCKGEVLGRQADRALRQDV